MDVEELIRSSQLRLLASIREGFAREGRNLSPRVADAAIAVPRHRFVERYRHWGSEEWELVDPGNLAAHLPVLYRDDPIGIAASEGAEHVATISQPSLVLLMLELLELEPGNRVFEVGAGSGWNAALMGKLVGPGGYVESVEIIPELAHRAQQALSTFGLDNVKIVAGDAGALPSEEGQFDRVVFTTGSYDIPETIFGRVRLGGLLLLVLKFPGGGDVLLVLRRHLDHFQSSTARSCAFVSMSGSGYRKELEPKALDDFPPWSSLQDKLVSERPFFGAGLGRAGFAARTHALRTFLTIREPRMCWFADPPGWPFFFFGLWDDNSRSLALARNGSLRSYGSEVASQILLQHMHDWVDLGMPSAVTMKVRAYKAGQSPLLAGGEHLLRRPATDFVWSESIMNAE